MELIKIKTSCYERTRCADARIFPHSVHGVILAHTGRGSDFIWGTGIMIASNVVLTAAHNLYNNQRPKRQKHLKFQFIPGINGDVAPFGIIDIDPDEVYVPESYITYQSNKIDGAYPDDYAILILSEPIGEKTGYFGVKLAEKNLLEDKEIQLFGYPGDKVIGKQGVYELWGSGGKILDFEHQQGILSHSISTYLGQSGGGLFIEEGPDQFYVVGIHVTGNEDFNNAIWMKKERFSQIQQWIAHSKLGKQKELLESRPSKLETVPDRPSVAQVQVLKSYEDSLSESGNLLLSSENPDRNSSIDDHLEIEKVNSEVHNQRSLNFLNLLNSTASAKLGRRKFCLGIGISILFIVLCSLIVRGLTVFEKEDHLNLIKKTIEIGPHNKDQMNEIFDTMDAVRQHWPEANQLDVQIIEIEVFYHNGYKVNGLQATFQNMKTKENYTLVSGLRPKKVDSIQVYKASEGDWIIKAIVYYNFFEVKSIKFSSQKGTNKISRPIQDPYPIHTETLSECYIVGIFAGFSNVNYKFPEMRWMGYVGFYYIPFSDLKNGTFTPWE